MKTWKSHEVQDRQRSIPELLDELHEIIAQEPGDIEIPDRQDRPNPMFAIIDAVCGAYKQYLSSSAEFARRKQEEIQLEEAKWQKL